MLQCYVETPTLRDLVGSVRSEDVAEAARSAGETLADMGHITFAKPGWLARGPTVTNPLLPGADPMARFVDQCLASRLQSRVLAELPDRTQAAKWSHAAALGRAADETSPVHGDFGGRNLIVRQRAGCWVVAAALDWEFAVSGSPLADVGHTCGTREDGRRPTAFRAGYLEGPRSCPRMGESRGPRLLEKRRCGTPQVVPQPPEWYTGYRGSSADTRTLRPTKTLHPGGRR